MVGNKCVSYLKLNYIRSELNMSKLVDKERLAKLAKALDDRAKAAVAAENERALAAEQAIEAKADANAAAIAAINNEETGLLKQAKDYADGVGNAEKERAEEQEGLLAGRIETLEGIIGGEAEGAFGEVKADVAENAAAIAKLNGGAEEEGSVAKAVADAVKVEKERAEGVEENHEGRIAANEAFVAAQPAIDQAQDQRLADLEAMMGMGGEEGEKTALEVIREDIEAAQDAADAAQADVDAVEQRLDAEGGLVDRIEANEANIARLDGAVEVEGSVKKQIKDAIDAVNQAADGLADRVEAVENFRDVTYPAAEAKVREDFAAADAQVLADAKKYADEEITKLVDSAPDAMNTLNELAAAINANQGVYDAYVAEHAAAMTKMKEDLQAEIDADVKVVNDAFNAEKERVAGVEAGFEARIAANEAFVAAQPAIDKAQDDRLKALEDANAEGGAMAEAVKAAQDAADAAQEAADNAQAAADAAQADVDAVELRADALEAKVGHDIEGENPATGLFLEVDEAKAAAQQAQNEVDAVEGRVDALEAFVEAHDHSAMEQGIADNKAAIEAEVGKDGEQGNRDKAIAAALEAYSTTEEMKQVIGNVVNSLALTMENDQVVLKLGGVDGIALTSVSLDMATDADIDAIIAGLDTPAGE